VPARDPRAGQCQHRPGLGHALTSRGTTWTPKSRCVISASRLARRFQNKMRARPACVNASHPHRRRAAGRRAHYDEIRASPSISRTFRQSPRSRIWITLIHSAPVEIRPARSTQG
jgi:hypothetical protein